MEDALNIEICNKTADIEALKAEKLILESENKLLREKVLELTCLNTELKKQK